MSTNKRGGVGIATSLMWSNKTWGTWRQINGGGWGEFQTRSPKNELGQDFDPRYVSAKFDRDRQELPPGER